jgi:hypothetical protein
MKGTTGIRIRRESAKQRLEAQLKRGTKPEKINGKTTTNMVALTDGDKKRIEREIETLSKSKNKTVLT